MDPAPPPGDGLCLFCDQVPAVNDLGLCASCTTSRPIRTLYRRRAGWTPAWEHHLRRLTERAGRRLPLFPGPNEGPSTTVSRV